MNRATDIDLRCHSSVRNVTRQPCSESHLGSGIDTRFVDLLTNMLHRRAVELMKIHRQLRLIPHNAPTADETVQVVVVWQPFAHISVSLIPNRPSNGIGHDRTHAAIVEPIGIPVGTEVSGNRGADFFRLPALFNGRFIGGNLLFQ